MEIGIKVDLETHKEHKHINMIKLKVNKILCRACEFCLKIQTLNALDYISFSYTSCRVLSSSTS